MKGRTKILMAIAVTLWVIGSILLYKKGGSNIAIISSGFIILIGFVTQIKKKETTNI